jgi:hypothetical protein
MWRVMKVGMVSRVSVPLNRLCLEYPHRDGFAFPH